MPTTFTSSAASAWKVDRYVEAVKSEAYRALVKTHGRFDADDIVSNVLLKLWTRIDEFMAAFPDPVVFAHAVCRNEGVDFVRRENAQRCAGARNQRPNVYGHDPDPVTGLCFFDTYDEEGDDVADLVVELLDQNYRWAEIRLGIPPREFEAMQLTCLEGYSDAEAGDIMGVTRESVNRWKNGGKRRLQEMLS